MKNRLMFLIGLSLISMSAIAHPKSNETHKNDQLVPFNAPHPLDSLYKGGAQAYSLFIRQNLRYPIESMKRRTQGTMIFSVTVNPQTGPKIDLLTRLDADIESAFLNTLSQTAANWIVKPDEYTFYQTVFFSVGKGFAEHFEEDPSFKKEFKGEWLDPTTSTVTMTVSKTRTTISGSRAPGGSRLPDRSGTPQFSAGYQFSEYKASKTRYQKQMKKNKAEKAFGYLNEIIRYNPFDREMIESRIQLAKDLGKTEYLKYDELLLKALK